MKYYNKPFMQFSSVVLLSLLTACAPPGYRYGGDKGESSFTLTPIPGYQQEQNEIQQRQYESGNIDCNKQTIMSTQDCVLGTYTKVHPTQQSIDMLKGYGITTPEQYDLAIAEANKHKDYATGSDSQPIDAWRNVANYLMVKKAAQDANETVEQWTARAKANAQKLAKEMNKKYPYTAELTCTFNGNNISLMACFAPSSANSSGTELEITNDGDYHMFQFMQINSAGSSMIDGVLTIPLSKSFQIKAQNNSNLGLLNLVVKQSATKKVVFRQSAGQFGVVAVKN